MNLIEILSWNEEQARQYLEKLRWNNEPICPHCGSKKHVKLMGKSTRQGLYKCKNPDCRLQYSVTVDTIFHKSKIPLRKWIGAFWLMCDSKKGISANQLKRDLGVTYKTAWLLAHKIRYAMKNNTFDKLKGKVEVDETYIGGKESNKHLNKRSKFTQGRSRKKTPVVALVEQGGKVLAKKLKSTNTKSLLTTVYKNVHNDSTIFTDEFQSYSGLTMLFKGGHKRVNHSKNEYFKDGVGTNTVECYFSLLKRGIYGVYHHVSPKHLDQYLNEFSFRWDYRKNKPQEVFEAALKNGEGKRLTYKNRINGYFDGKSDSSENPCQNSKLC